MTAVALAHLGAGMREPVHGAQQAFRTLLDAFAAPGRVFTLPALALDGIAAPPDTQGRVLPPALPALLLTLLDHETPLRLHGTLDGAAWLQYLRFHTGVRPADPAAFEVLHAADLSPALLDAVAPGTDEHPQLGATVIVAVDSLQRGLALRLQGPGIADVAVLQVAGVAADTWAWRQRHQRDYPRGLDLVLVCGAQVAALPRSTRILEIG